ncbi:ATP-dependent endonuclease [Chloroflexota bacterium]
MWITRIKLSNVRSFKTLDMSLSKGINILVGANNSGKSTVLHAAGNIQANQLVTPKDMRIGTTDSRVELILNEDPGTYFNNEAGNVFCYELNTNQSMLQGHNVRPIPSIEPVNFIYPYLSKRKTAGYQETMNETNTNAVSGNLHYLYAKVDRISNPEFQPAHELYMKACDDILGFRITSVSSKKGKKAAYIIRTQQHIPLEVMGEGVANIVGLLVDLCVAEDKLFLIEEPENDIHPKALKSLLSLIAEKSENNQFIVTTHSHIVTKYLGSNPGSKIFNVTTSFKNKVPNSQVEEVPPDIESRRNILENLGYELMDVDLWDGWLILEESSAEKIIREHLIPWFTPNLNGKLRTFSARTVNELEIKFNDLNNLFVFLNMEPVYKNKAWIIIDFGEKEKGIIERLKEMYTDKGWNENNFQQFSEHDFERYYPKIFQGKVTEIQKMPTHGERFEGKKELRAEVEKWIEENDREARKAFEISASEVIEKLKAIEKAISDTPPEAKF